MGITLTPKTNQEAFDIAVRRLYDGTGMSRSINDEGSFACEYRTADGRKCVVGEMIADEDYDPRFEDKGIRELVENGYVTAEPLNVRLLTKLQILHDDDTHWVGDMFASFHELIALGNEFGLDTSLVIELSSK